MNERDATERAVVGDGVPVPCAGATEPVVIADDDTTLLVYRMADVRA